MAFLIIKKAEKTVKEIILYGEWNQQVKNGENNGNLRQSGFFRGQFNIKCAIISNMKNFFKIPYKRILIEILLAVIFVPIIAYNNIYFPIKKIENNINFDYEDVVFYSADNTKLSGWYFPPRGNKPAIILSHGNWGNISYFSDLFIPVNQKGYGVFIYDYRGFGKSNRGRCRFKDCLIHCL